MTRKSLVATVVGIAAVAAPSAFADKGGIPHDGSNGQGSAAAQQQTAATAPHGKALAKGHAKTHGKALAKGHAKTHSKRTTAAPKTTGTPTTNTHAKAGKTTICHATGSATNPYVTITISNNAIPAHQRHQDGRDIIPAPAGGCPTQAQQSQPQPSTATQQPSGSTKQAAAPSATPATPSTAAQPTEQGAVLGTSVSGSSTSPTSGSSAGSSAPAEVHVLGATTSSGSPSASASPAATATRAASSSRLPFTGTDVIIVAILGLAALLLGVTARRASSIKS